MEKRAACEICGQMFKHSRAVKAHMKAHSAPNAVQCEFCGKAFSLRAAYVNHVKIHDPATSGRSRRRRHTIIYQKPQSLPAERPPVIETVQVEDMLIVQEPVKEVVEKCGVEQEEQGNDPQVRCWVCVTPVRWDKMWTHLQRHARLLLQGLDDTSRCLQDYDVVLEL